jgi:hypothetical protein
MAHTLKVLIEEPTAIVTETEQWTIISYGVPSDLRGCIKRRLSDLCSPNKLGHIVQECDEANLIVIEKENAGARRLLAWRGNTSSYEIYYLLREPRNELILSDNFRNLLALLEIKERTLSREAIADLILFGVTPGEGTFVTSICRLGHGTHLRWVNGRVTRSIFDRLEVQPSVQDPLKQLDRALESVTRRVADKQNCVNQLSGGVDSTLIQSYLLPSIPSISATINSPEFRFEMGYALKASRLLGTHHELIEISEEHYFDAIKGTILHLGYPPHMMQTSLYEAVYKTAFSNYITSQFADALFGLPRTRWAHRAFVFGKLLRPIARVPLTSRLPGPIQSKLDIYVRRARQIQAPVLSWQGLAMQFAFYTDTGNLGLAVRLLGEDTVRTRIEQRAEYVRARFRSMDESGNWLHAHLEFGHMIDFYCDDSVTQWRQLAQWHGKSLIAPFLARPVVECALAVPRSRRYIKRNRVKYLLKDLLKCRLPAFDADAPKGAGDLPIKRYLESGCLKGVFDQFPMPDFVEPTTAAGLTQSSVWITWSLLTFAIWQDLVLRDQNLGLRPRTRTLNVSLYRSPPISA